MKSTVPPERVAAAPPDLDLDPRALRAEVDRLRSDLGALESRHAELRRLASFPEQNPNLVIETDLHGQVTYLNPIARNRFPDLETLGFAHPLLCGITDCIGAFHAGERVIFTREARVGDAVFELKICQPPEGALARVFAHDITAMKRAEAAIEHLAEQRRRLAQRVLSAQEEERRRLSGELHDEAGQALTALKIGLELLRGEAIEAAPALVDDLSDVIDLVNTTRERLRGLAHDLRPPALDTLGLDAALEGFCRGYAGRVQLSLDYAGGAVPGIGDTQALCLYRFLQEALTNVARHAEASHVGVTLEADADEVCLTVTDDGCGFHVRDVGQRRTTSGIGLAGMRERLELVGGRMEIESGDGSGTRVSARVPRKTAP